jgi:hypothetical protein
MSFVPLLHGFFNQTQISLFLDPLSITSKISIASVHALEIPSVFTDSGDLTCTIPLVIPTVGGCYHSCLSLVVGYNLLADLVLGRDWADACQPTLTEDQSAILHPSPLALRRLALPHRWYPVPGSFITLSYIITTLIIILAPVNVSQAIWGADSQARDALAFILNECCVNDMFCIDLLHDHQVTYRHASYDDRRDVVLTHLLKGMCALTPSSPSCKMFAQDSLSSVHLSYILSTLLLSGYENKQINFHNFNLCCASMDIHATSHRFGRDQQRKLEQLLKVQKPVIECVDVFASINKLHKLSIGSLTFLASLHDIRLESTAKDVGCDAIISHIVSGACDRADGCLCGSTRSAFPVLLSSSRTYSLQLRILKGVLKTVNRKAFSRILHVLNISHSPDDTIKMFRSMLRSHCTSLREQMQETSVHAHELNTLNSHKASLASVASSWPQRIPYAEKANIIHDFRSLTSSKVLKSFTCASCAERVRDINRADIPITDINLDLLYSHVSPACDAPPLPFTDGPLRGVLVDPSGVIHQSDGSTCLSLCVSCKSALSRNKLPRFSLANLNVLGTVPPELQDLTLVEELIVARCRAKLCIVKLQDHRDDVELPTVQRGIKGHVIVFPQHPETMAEVMPAQLSDIVTLVCIIFCGSTKPTLEWLKEKARPLVVRRDAVLKALQWLRVHNPLYKDVIIDATRISVLPEEDVLGHNIEHIPLSTSSHALVSRYDAPTGLVSMVSAANFPPPQSDDHVQFERVTITDVDVHAPSYQLKAAALRHAKRGGSFIEVPHDSIPVNEFFNPSMFPMLYPTLFPYGTGGFEDRRRNVAIGLENHIRHMLALADKRFQQHFSFMFVAFNVLQRRKLLLHTSLRVNRSNFNSWAQRFTCISTEAINSLAKRTSNGGPPSPVTDDEKLVFELMKEVKAISSNVPGSPDSRLTMRNEIRANILSLGVPSFFITVNPADVYNPIVKFLAGNDIDIDNLLSNQVPTYWDQAGIIAHNPCIAAEFFDVYINAFISAILQYDPKQRSTQPGILGVTKAYYGCVEAQGRGSLHCHMVVWVHGGLTADEIRNRAMTDHSWRDRLVDFLDDTICNVVPIDPDPLMSVQSCQHHACAVRGIDVATESVSEDTLKARMKDLRNVVLQSQCHSHTSTCYKYHTLGQVKSCRFNLEEDNVQPKTFFNDVTGTLVMRHLDGMVNNFCPTITEAVRCNSDIKFMASGDAAKSILFYITDYITKTGNKSHVSFGALEVALKKLGDYDPKDTDTELRAKKMLQKCVYAVLSHQELSGQQVAAYLKGYGDHYSSHKYRNLYWTAFERSVEIEDPSPECYQQDTSMAKIDERSVSSEEFDDSEDNEIPDDVSNTMLSAIDEGEGDDVTIAVAKSGTVVQCSSQVHDYRFRAFELRHLSVWQFISSVDKITNPKSRQQLSDDETIGSEDQEIMSNKEAVDGCEGGIPKSFLPSQGSKKSKTFQLHPEHMQYGMRAQRLRRDPFAYYIPVAIGPALPRRDRELVYAKYCRLMLILFKPWQEVGDLREAGETWIQAFDQFAGACSKDIKQVLNNMQVLHECKDAKDIEDCQRRNNRREASRSMRLGRSEVEEFVGEVIDDDLLEHLDSVVNYASERRLKVDADVIECLNEIQQSGILSLPEQQSTIGDVWNDVDEIMLPDNLPLEDIWRAAYKNRHNAWKQNLCVAPDPQSSAQPQHFGPTIMSFDVTAHLPTVTNVKTLPQKAPVAINDVIVDWTLNIEQARAFSLIASHSQKIHENEPLRLYLGGPGGTGKSRVITALTHYFNICGETRRLRLASFTGIAAKNINGTTLHTALALNQGQKGHKVKGKTKADLIAMWLGVDYLFIDEVSMIGCNLLLQIHEALVEAKGCTQPFGGISVIFAGDFAQLPPVSQTKLFSRTKWTSEAVIFGQLLWRSVTMVVMLTKQMRQAGPENHRFVEMLSRLRDGRCNQDDYELLNTRLLCSAINGSSCTQWQDAPMIVYTNAIKDAINLEATKAFARRTGKQVHWYHAVDSYRGQPIEDEAINDLLDTLPSNKTGGRLRALPLVLGMPVMVTENFDVAGGIVNGSTGFLRKVRYHIDDNNRRYITSCIVEVSDVTADSLPNLPLKHIPVLPGEVDMKAFRHPKSGHSLTLRRYQIPLDAAFARTAHKAQGQTMTRVVVDLASCIGTEAAYVMISRCTSLSGLMVLRPFPIAKITVHRSQDARDEFRRLERLNTQTKSNCGENPSGIFQGPAVRKTAEKEGAPQVVTLFSGPSPLDVGGARKLLIQIWDNKNDNGGNGKSDTIPSLV